MPILAGDRLIGRIDTQLDKTIHLLQLEPDIPVISSLRRHVTTALQAFAEQHGARKLVVERTEHET